MRRARKGVYTWALLAYTDDGLLGDTTIGSMPRLQLVRLSIDIMEGTSAGLSNVMMALGRRVEVVLCLISAFGRMRMLSPSDTLHLVLRCYLHA